MNAMGGVSHLCRPSVVLLGILQNTGQIFGGLARERNVLHLTREFFYRTRHALSFSPPFLLSPHPFFGFTATPDSDHGAQQPSARPVKFGFICIATVTVVHIGNFCIATVTIVHD